MLFDLTLFPELFSKYWFSYENATPSTRHRPRVVKANLD